MIESIKVMVLAMSSEFTLSIKNPVFPSTIVSGAPPDLNAIAGVNASCDSSGVKPKGSPNAGAN